MRPGDKLKPQAQSENKQRLAFAKAHANEMWPADTLYGPYLSLEGTAVQTRHDSGRFAALRMTSRK